MNIHIHHHHYIEPGEELMQMLNLINKKLDKIMTKQERLDAAIANLNDATNEIASDLKVLKDEITAGTVSDESIAKLEANIEVLDALGQEQ